MILFFMLLFSTLWQTPSRAEQMQITHRATQQIGLRIAYLGCAAQRLSEVIATDMAVSGHYAIDRCEYWNAPTKKTAITALMQEGILFLLILESQQNAVAYRLYDTTTGDMITVASGSCAVLDDTDRRYGHYISDKLWQALMGEVTIFHTKIAYAKEIPYKKGIAVKHICVADYDGRNEDTMVKLPTIAMAPRWGGTKENPLIFYSEFTKTNVRLMCVNQRKKRAIITRYDGNSMHFTQNHDRSAYAYSASRGDGKSHIYLMRNKELEQCSFGEVNDASPTFNHDSAILYYCSDEKTGSPHIMAYTIATKKSVALPIKGSCVSPAHNPKKKLLAYSKMVDGCMQIFSFDTLTQQEKQLTWDAGHHTDPTWSPCGNYIAYAHQVGNASRIRIMCIATGHEQYVTPAGVNCSYPAWSLW